MSFSVILDVISVILSVIAVTFFAAGVKLVQRGAKLRGCGWNRHSTFLTDDLRWSRARAWVRAIILGLNPVRLGVIGVIFRVVAVTLFAEGVKLAQRGVKVRGGGWNRHSTFLTDDLRRSRARDWVRAIILGLNSVRLGVISVILGVIF
jgi:hypothetical protein